MSRSRRWTLVVLTLLPGFVLSPVRAQAPPAEEKWHVNRALTVSPRPAPVPAHALPGRIPSQCGRQTGREAEDRHRRVQYDLRFVANNVRRKYRKNWLQPRPGEQDASAALVHFRVAHGISRQTGNSFVS